VKALHAGSSQAIDQSEAKKDERERESQSLLKGYIKGNVNRPMGFHLTSLASVLIELNVLR
jgi:hypothetical protein